MQVKLFNKIVSVYMSGGKNLEKNKSKLCKTTGGERGTNRISNNTEEAQ